MPLAHQQGGAEALLMHFLRHGSKRFEILCIFLEEGPLVEQARAMGYPTFVTRTTHLSDIRNYVRTVLWLRRWIHREQPDAILSWMAKAHLYVAPAATMSGIKTTWFLHGILQKNRLDRITTLLPASWVFCCSGAAKAAQENLRPRRPSSICYPGVTFPSPHAIPTRQARAQLGLDTEAPIVGMVARLERWKGVHIFIEAAKIAFAANPETYFFVVGGPHPRDLAYADEIRTLAAHSGLADHFILADQRPPSEVSLWQASADLIVHPVTGQEPFGMAVVEAMGMGRVVVATDAGGPREIINDGVNGFLVPPGDAKALGNKIVELLQDSDELERVGGNAFVRGRSFSVSRFADRLEELLADTLA